MDSARQITQMLCFLQLCKYKTVYGEASSRRVKQSRCKKNKAIKIRVYIYTPLDLLKLSKPEQYCIQLSFPSLWILDVMLLSHEGRNRECYCNYISCDYINSYNNNNKSLGFYFRQVFC